MADGSLPFPATRTLAEFVATLDFDQLPGEVRRAARRSLLDQIGVILAAGTLGADCRAFVELAQAGGGAGAPIIGHGTEASPALAALSNGAMAHALDFEETHDATLVHPSASTVPAALAVAGQAGVSGQDLLVALVAGAETSIRIAMSFIGNPQSRGDFYVLPLIGAFGAAAAAGRILRLNPGQMGHAFSLAMSQVVGSAAVLDDPTSSVREVRDGFNAKAGVLAALLAKRGVKGFPHVFEAPAGYYALFQDGQFDPQAFVGLGSDFECARVSYKPWPACRGAHVFIEAALALAEKHELEAGEIAAVEAEVSPFFAALFEPPDIRRKPATAAGAKFSVPYCVAVGLLEGRVDLSSFSSDRRRDPAVLDLAECVFHKVVDRPQAQSTQGALTLVTKGGARHRMAVDTALGHPDRPLSDADLREKFTMCAAHAVSRMTSDQAGVVADAIDGLSHHSDGARRLLTLL